MSSEYHRFCDSEEWKKFIKSEAKCLKLGCYVQNKTTRNQ